jgi:hypothetical protein
MVNGFHQRPLSIQPSHPSLPSVLWPCVCSEGTGTKVVYGDFRRWLPEGHRFRTQRDFGSHELRLSPPLREDSDIRAEAKAAAASRETFGVAEGSVYDPSRASGVTGQTQLARLKNLHLVLAFPAEFMHVMVSRRTVSVLVCACEWCPPFWSACSDA